MHYKAEYREKTKDTLAGWFITGPSILGQVYEEHDGMRLAQFLSEAYQKGLDNAR